MGHDFKGSACDCGVLTVQREEWSNPCPRKEMSADAERVARESGLNLLDPSAPRMGPMISPALRPPPMVF
jgi:hypothetical protein